MTATAETYSGRATGARYVVLAALCLAAIIAYIQRNSIGAFVIPIRGELEVGNEQAGAILGSFFWAYASSSCRRAGSSTTGAAGGRSVCFVPSGRCLPPWAPS